MKHYTEKELWQRLAKRDSEIKEAMEKGWDPPPINCLWEELMETLGSSNDYIFELLTEFEDKYNTTKKKLQRLLLTDLIHYAIDDWKASLETVEELDCDKCEVSECPLRDRGKSLDSD